jgi:hypothetical protein
VTEAPGTRPSLSNDDVRQVVALGGKVQQEYGAPKISNGRWQMAGSTAASTADHLLYPPPVESLDPLIIWFSFGSSRACSIRSLLWGKISFCI